MDVDNFPDSLLHGKSSPPDLFVYDLKMEEEVVRSKVQLNLHMFSFLQRGRKQVNFPCSLSLSN
jgi:hypothetical protein